MTKLEALADRHQEVEALLGDAEVINDQNRFRDLSVEVAQLNDVVAQYQRWRLVSRRSLHRSLESDPRPPAPWWPRGWTWATAQ